LKVKAPRHTVHSRLGMSDEETEELLDLAGFLSHGVLLPGLQVNQKSALFSSIAHHLSRSCDASVGEIEAALWHRERSQNTALAEGVALTAPMVAGLDRNLVGVFCTQAPLDYRSPGRPMVDAVIVVLGSPGHRQNQLWLLERLSRLVLRGELLAGLRKAQTSDEMIEAIQASAERVGVPLG
ncbi:MAG: PTS sugar transporter subunit IIA, partial [Myxococcota bacterium]|nr:PTS sugar transporter subunit IIA [Myxococcota bacterium]